MFETATTTEMKSHYDCAHALRAAAFRVAIAWLVARMHHAKEPRQMARPPHACAAC